MGIVCVASPSRLQRQLGSHSHDYIDAVLDHAGSDGGELLGAFACFELDG